MKIKLLQPRFAYGANSYLISSNDEYMVIDPSSADSLPEVRDKLKFVFLTHSHIDHMLLLDKWITESSAPLLLAEPDIPLLTDSEFNCHRLFFGCDGGYYGEATPLSDGDTVSLGDEVLRVMITPGHTNGSTVLVGDGYAFVGDLVFKGGGFGRYDFKTGDPIKLFKSIERLLELDDDTVLYPGHGEPTTVSDYKSAFSKYR